MAQSATNQSIAYLQRQRLLLQMEYYVEKEAFRKQTALMGVERLVSRGDAWFPLRVGKTYYNSLNQLSIEVFRLNADGETAHDDSVHDHHFEYGRPVQFFKSAPSRDEGGGGVTLHYFSFVGTVSFVDGDRMVVTVPDSAPLIDLQSSEQPIGCQLSFDETSYRAMFDALDRVIKAKDNRLAQLRDWVSPQQASPQRASPLPPPKGGGDPSSCSRESNPVGTPPPFGGGWGEALNPSQSLAVRSVLACKDVAIVHGPPGTGKTTTLVEAINEVLMREPQVLVCAQSNMAVDWIAEKLVDRGINVLRIGNPTRVNDKMLSFTYERRFEAHPDYATLWSIRRAIRDLRSKGRRGSENYHQKLNRLKSRATEIELRIQAELFGSARVIASTLVGADNRLLHGMTFHTLFIDEAAQALEAACWIPMRRCRRVVFAGDHCQLPPTIKSIAALKAGLGVTLMERIVKNHPEVVTLLRTQYRMNDQIMRFSSNWFYGGQVESAPMVHHRGILDYDYPMEWRSLSPAPVVDSPSEKSGEVRRGNQGGGSIFNTLEAEQTLQALEDYFTKIGKQRVLEEQIDVGIISPYRAQVQLLRSLLKKRAFFKPFRRLITVNTVDGFQGQERDVIVISLVRSNDEGQIGFLRDLRRMNVAITRARMKLIILGDVATLTRHPFYRKLYDYIQSLREE